MTTRQTGSSRPPRRRTAKIVRTREDVDIETGSTRWTDAAGNEWQIYTRWSVVNGRATLVGIDIRSFFEMDGFYPIGERLVELTQPVFRSIPIATIRDGARTQIREVLENSARMAADSHTSDRLNARARELGLDFETAPDLGAARNYAKKASAYTAAGQPRRRMPAAGPEVLEEVARLYLRTVMAGDKTPAKTVEAQLRAAGWPVSERGGRDQVRKWIQRARERKLIPPVGREVETLNRIPT